MVFWTGEETAFEFPYPTTRGTRYFHMRLVPEYSKEGRIESVLTIGRDVTDLKQVLEELRRARDELEFRVQERTAELARTRYRRIRPLCLIWRTMLFLFVTWMTRLLSGTTVPSKPMGSQKKRL